MTYRYQLCILQSFIYFLVVRSQFFVGVQTFNIELNCTFQNVSICCSVLEENPVNYHQISVETSAHHHKKCDIKRVYHPSPYESRHIEAARKFNLINVNHSLAHLISFVTSPSEILAARIWLARVREHMKSPNDPSITLSDIEYLSYFNVTKSCHGETSVSWKEWIEPITVHARNPFSWNFANHTEYHGSNSVNIFNVDHIILQSKQNLDRQSDYGPRRQYHRRSMNFLFDAGTSRFDSSLWFFHCAYAQVCFLIIFILRKNSSVELFLINHSVGR